MSASVAIVTAANSNHFPLATDMFRSLAAATVRKLSLCCLDLGLNANERDALASLGVELVEPQWDYPGEFPAPWFRAMTARPHLQRYFPGHSTYIWIDADCWLQNDVALETLIKASASHDVALVASVHHDYRQVIATGPDQFGPPTQYFYAHLMQSLFNRQVAAKLSEMPYLNGGVFAMRDVSPVWKTWQEALGPMFERARNIQRPAWQGKEAKPPEGISVNIENKALFHSEEVALNFAAWRAKPAILDATCNWLCSQRLPALNAKGKFVTPGYQATELSIIHLTARTKDTDFRIRHADGTHRMMSLRAPVHVTGS